MKEEIVIVGAGVSGVNAATKLIDNGYPGELITIIDMGKDPYRRDPEQLMEGFLGAGGFSDGKLTYHTSIGGHLLKYCGEEKAMSLMDEVIENFKRFHPDPEKIKVSHPIEEPDFIKPNFNLRLFPVYHIGTDYLVKLGQNWYDFLVESGVTFLWETKVLNINFDEHYCVIEDLVGGMMGQPSYDKLFFGVGKSGIDFCKHLTEENKLETESKPVQVGVRFEAPQKHFQKIIDLAYDFKLYQKFEDEGVSLRTFCTNNHAAYVAVENTYGDISYNGHAKKGEQYKNGMTNFGILMEIQDIENPFVWSRELVDKCQFRAEDAGDHAWGNGKCGLFYSPKGTRRPSFTSEGNYVKTFELNPDGLKLVRNNFKGYFEYIEDFIEDLKIVFPTLKDDWGVYVPEVKYLSAEPIVDYKNLSLKDYPDVYFVGDTLSARGITVSGAQAIYAAESILNK